MDILKVDILSVSNLSIGNIASIKFPEGIHPSIGMIVEFNNQKYKIKGSILFADPADSLINNNKEKNIYECHIELAE